MHTNTFCKYRKKLRASPRVHLVRLRVTEPRRQVRGIKCRGHRDGSWGVDIIM